MALSASALGSSMPSVIPSLFELLAIHCMFTPFRCFTLVLIPLLWGWERCALPFGSLWGNQWSLPSIWGDLRSGVFSNSPSAPFTKAFTHKRFFFSAVYAQLIAFQELDALSYHWPLRIEWSCGRLPRYRGIFFCTIITSHFWRWSDRFSPFWPLMPLALVVSQRDCESRTTSIDRRTSIKGGSVQLANFPQLPDIAL